MARDRKLVKSGGQRVELSVALSVAGFIRSEGGIYVGPSVIYRFRWHTRYRYTDIDTSLVRERGGLPPVSFPLIPFLSFESSRAYIAPAYILLLLPLESLPRSFSTSSARLDLPGDTCGVDPVNTTSSIVKAKRSASGVGTTTAGISSRRGRPHIRRTEIHMEIYIGARCALITARR